MKTFNKFKRVCAMTLTALMIIQQSNVTTFASDIEAAAEAMAQSEEAQNAADGSENNTAAETTSQETPAQTEPVQTESAQPEQVQEQQQQETTPATEQQPAVTPETQKTTADTANAAQEQEATSEAQPTEEAHPVATGAVPTQEAEKETATVQDLAYNADGVQVNVHTNTAVAADTQLVVKPVNPDEFENAALNQWLQDKTVAGAAIYDIHLADANGNEVTAGQATVNLNFTSPVVPAVEGMDTTLSFLHIANGSTVEVGQVNAEGTSATITANGFSPFVFVRTSEDAVETLDVINGTDANSYITSVSVKTNGTPLDRNNGSIEGKFEFEIPNVDKNCSSVYFDIPVEYLSLIASTGNQVRDDNGTAIGSFTLDTITGRVVMNFLDDYYKNNSEIKGYFQYDAKVKTDAIDDKDEITISFNDNVSATIQLKPGNINGWKDGKFELGEDGNLYINYEIWIDADSKLKNFKLEDELGTNLEYVPGSFTWKKDGSGTEQSVDPTIIGNKATYELSTIEKGKYCFAYKAKVLDKTSTDKLSNLAKWNWKGNTEGNSSSKDMQISKVSISKSGKDFFGKTTSWTVRLNKGDATTKNEMTEGKYTDKLPEGMSLVDGTLKIKDTQNGRELVNGIDYILKPTADGFLIEFRDQGAVKVPSYEITYDTTLTGPNLPANNTQYKNEGTFTPNGGDPVKGEGTSSYKKDDSNRIKKQVSNVQYEENGDATSDWEIVIDPLGEELKDIEVSDTFDTSKHTGILKSSIKVKTESGQKITPTFNDSETIELQGHDGYYQKFKIKLLGTYSEKIYVTYKAKTFYDDIKSAEVDIVNNVGVIVNNQWKGANDRFTYRKDTGAMTKVGSKDESYFKWVVKMNIDPDCNWLAAKDYGENDVLSMTDVIPEGMTLVQKGDKSPKVSCNYEGGKELSDGTNCWNYDESTRTFTVNVSNFGKKFVWVVYWTKVNDNFVSSGDYAFTNDASYSYNGKQMDSASATVIEKGKDLSKISAEQTTDNIVTYTVDVNPDAKTLNDGNELTLTDKIPVGCSYVPKSIKFLEGEDAVISREYKNGTLTLKIKDASHVKFTYELKVLGEIGDKVEVSNSITLTGKNTISSSDNKTVIITKTTAGASGEKGTFKVVKIDSKTEAPLEGATFILQKMKYSDGTFVNDGEPVAKTTDSTGGTAFGEKFVSNDQPAENSILYDTLYYWQETKAPDGYSLSDSEKNTKHYFYIGGNSLATLQGWLAGAGAEFQNAEQVNFGNYIVSNTKIEKPAPGATEAQITAKKTVNGETAKGSLFQFTLTPKTAGDANKAQTVRNADGNITFNKLTYETAGTYKYEVSENQDVPTGYTADTKTHEVTVEVADKDGQLVAAVKYAEADKDGIVFENTYEKTFKIRKTDIGGKELKDAKFVLSGKEEGGKDITPISWTSDGTAKEITVKPGTYTLEETAAPEGYNTIQSKVTITVDKEGKVTVTGSAEITVNGKKVSEVSAEGDEIIVKDTLKGSSITVTKNLVHNGEALEAINATFYVALYNDEACTDRASDVKAIEFKNASASTASFTDVKVGKEYYVAECDENGNALTTGEIAGATFMANFSSSNKVSVEKENDSSIIYFTNEFLTIPDGFYKEAKLTITKKLLGTDGKAKNGDGKFYAGIFMDKDHTELADSNTVSANIVELDLNDVSEASQTVKFGVGKNDKLTFYIAETDAEGNPVADDEDFSYKVTYSAESATFDITHLSAAVTIVNRETSSEKTEVTETTNKTSGSPNSTAKTAVKTGDDTPILPFVIILLAAIAAIVVFVKKRFGSKKN